MYLVHNYLHYYIFIKILILLIHYYITIYFYIYYINTLLFIYIYIILIHYYLFIYSFYIINVNKIEFNKVFTNVKKSKDRFKFIPLTTNTKYFDKLILNDISLYLDRINDQRAILNEDKLLMDKYITMYLYQDQYVILNREDNNIIYRSVYDCVSGILIAEVVDNIISTDFFLL